MSIVEHRIAFCRGMLELCQKEAIRWEGIELALTRILMHMQNSRSEPLIEVSDEDSGGESLEISSTGSVPLDVQERAADPSESTNMDQPVNEVPVVPERPVVPPPRPRNILAERIAHLVQIMLIMYMISLPRVFHYFFVGYALLVLSGLSEVIRTVNLRQLLGGARPSLSLQLARLRERQESLSRLAALYTQREELGTFSETEEAEVKKLEEFLASFNETADTPKLPLRFMYQLFVMLFYSAFPECFPHSRFLV
jgi:hypothetical protein